MLLFIVGALVMLSMQETRGVGLILFGLLVFLYPTAVTWTLIIVGAVMVMHK